MKTSFYAVEIKTPESGLVISRIFSTIKAARRWAVVCSKRWETRILKGGAGGMPVV